MSYTPEGAIVSATRKPTNLHLPGCLHFYDDKPPRAATIAEVAQLPLCSDCLRRALDALVSTAPR